MTYAWTVSVCKASIASDYCHPGPMQHTVKSYKQAYVYVASSEIEFIK